MDTHWAHDKSANEIVESSKRWYVVSERLKMRKIQQKGMINKKRKLKFLSGNDEKLGVVHRPSTMSYWTYILDFPLIKRALIGTQPLEKLLCAHNFTEEEDWRRACNSNSKIRMLWSDGKSWLSEINIAAAASYAFFHFHGFVIFCLMHWLPLASMLSHFS